MSNKWDKQGMLTSVEYNKKQEKENTELNFHHFDFICFDYYCNNWLLQPVTQV